MDNNDDNNAWFQKYHDRLSVGDNWEQFCAMILNFFRCSPEPLKQRSGEQLMMPLGCWTKTPVSYTHLTLPTILRV